MGGLGWGGHTTQKGLSVAINRDQWVRFIVVVLFVCFLLFCYCSLFVYCCCCYLRGVSLFVAVVVVVVCFV